MNYWIQGDAAKADKIKAAFERLGYDITYPDGCANPAALNIGVEIDGAKFVVPETLTYIHYIIKTHPDYKELELPVEPKFKVGDEIIWGSKPTEPVKIIQLIDKDRLYMVDMQNGVGYVAYDMQDYYKLVPKPHYDISNFYAGMPVLVRDDESDDWRYIQFSHTRIMPSFRFVAGGGAWRQCIPFNEETKHLLGTTDMPDDMYINW